MRGPVEAREIQERRDSNRRAANRGGRRKGDKRFPWWRGGMAFAALCMVLRCWRWVRR